MIIVLPEKVKLILNTLIAAGYEAYAVGGCVRDSLLCRIPNDWDITTSAKPEEVKAIFNRTIDTGIKHGTVTVMFGKEGYEVTTYRIDGEYVDCRHPEEVSFTADLSEDLRRRDFTINAMAYNEQDGLVDLFGGQEDIRRGIIRAVGDAKERFTEDALRIMRAVRFAAQLGYEIDPDTAKAAEKLAPNLKKISAERINTELTKLLESNHPELLLRAYELGITKQFIPEFDLCMETKQNNPHHCYSVGLHTIHSVCNIKPNGLEKDVFRVLRIAMLLHDIGKPACKFTDKKGIDHFNGHQDKGEVIAKTILKRLKYDNKTIDFVCSIVKFHDMRPEITPMQVRRAINLMGLKTFDVLEYVQRADITAQSDFKREEKLERLKGQTDLYKQIIENKDPLFIGDLAIGGNDIINNNIASGKQIGSILHELMEEVLEAPEKNNREYLLKAAKEWND